MEFSDIQPVSQSGQLQPTSISSAAGLSSIFNSRANAGDQIEMFLAIAEGQPETAITSFSTVVRNLSYPPIKGLALQGFSKISQPYKQALALCASKESQELLKLLCNEIRNKNSDLTIWAAAEALREIGFSFENVQQVGNLSEPPRRIQNEIIERKIQEINKVQRLSSQGGFTTDYERFLEFWIYGPTTVLLGQSLTTSNYLDIINDILHFTQIRGIQLGLNSDNLRVQNQSFDKLRSVFKQYSDSKDDAFKKVFTNSLSRFLEDESNKLNDLQKLAKALLFRHSSRMDSLGIDLEKLDLAWLSVEKMKNCILSLEKDCYELSSIFTSAINVSGEPNLNRLMEGDLNVHSQKIKNWINQFRNQIALVEAEQNKIKTNIFILGDSFSNISATDEEFFDDQLDSLYKEYYDCWEKCLGYMQFPEASKAHQELQLQSPQTLEECSALQSKLRSIKDKLLSEIRSRMNSLSSESRSLSDNSKFEKIKEDARSLVVLGAKLFIFAFILSLIFGSCSSSFDGKTNDNQSQMAAWYETGYPKEQCGNSSSSNNCWYPVFITYTDSNWSRIIRKCKDVPEAQSQSIAKQREQILIASFSNEADAKGFAEFIDAGYDGASWMGQRKCR